VHILITLRAIPTAAQLLAGPHLLDSSGGGHQMKRAPCRSRGSEVATPPFDLPYTALTSSHETLYMLTVFYMRTGRQMII
jgi:hypothetical protein